MIERKAWDSKASTEDAEKGIIHAVVSVFGNVDSDGDVMLKGAFAGALSTGKTKGKYPPGVWAHDWSLPVAKTLDAYEDDEGLHVLGQFNLETQRGRETFSDIKNGLITEYSFGFRVTDADRKDGQRHIKTVEWYEWSPVLVGANRETRTVGVKSHGSFEEHCSGVLAALEALTDRAREIAALRAEKGHSLSGQRRADLQKAQAAVQELLQLTEPRADQQQIQQVLIQRAVQEARRLGLDV